MPNSGGNLRSVVLSFILRFNFLEYKSLLFLLFQYSKIAFLCFMAVAVHFKFLTTSIGRLSCLILLRTVRFQKQCQPRSSLTFLFVLRSMIKFIMAVQWLKLRQQHQVNFHYSLRESYLLIGFLFFVFLSY